MVGDEFVAVTLPTPCAAVTLYGVDDVTSFVSLVVLTVTEYDDPTALGFVTPSMVTTTAVLAAIVWPPNRKHDTFNGVAACGALQIPF